MSETRNTQKRVNRRYNENWLAMFFCVEYLKRPLCVLCGKLLSANRKSNCASHHQKHSNHEAFSLVNEERRAEALRFKANFESNKGNFIVDERIKSTVKLV